VETECSAGPGPAEWWRKASGISHRASCAGLAGLGTAALRPVMCSASAVPIEPGCLIEANCRSEGLSRTTRPWPSQHIPRWMWLPRTASKQKLSSVCAGHRVGGAPRRNRTADPILTMEPPGTAVRNPVSPGRARPSRPKLSVQSTCRYAFSWRRDALLIAASRSLHHVATATRTKPTTEDLEADHPDGTSPSHSSRLEGFLAGSRDT
jgi:hypothetical protein